uniref:Toll-like receptor n=1 Tax=Suberites domuncula TaxID=55567 RepID=A7M856_SUBDO|nr:Toll-like receptor [Suberites domuncula]
MSTFSCSLVRRTSQVNSLQWKRVANLTVTESLGKNSHLEQMFRYLFAILLLVIVIVAVVVAVLVAVCVRRRKSRHKQVNPDQVPLTCNSVHSSRSTLCGSEANTPITQFGRLPSVEISVSHGRQRNDGLVVNEQYPPTGSMETHSSDSGVAMNSSTEDMYGNTSIRQSPPFSLHIPRDIHHRRIDTSDKFDLSRFDKFVVYISYTNQMSDWVRNDLKPLIESWHTAIEVNIHENSMIPGYSVSGERHRLILEADKIVIVVSRDYSTSSWCVYELEHAIHQQPALCNGRVIPILTDNCNSLPGIISGVVCLGEDEPDFEGRLRHAIFKKPQGGLVRV